MWLRLCTVGWIFRHSLDPTDASLGMLLARNLLVQEPNRVLIAMSLLGMWCISAAVYMDLSFSTGPLTLYGLLIAAQIGAILWSAVTHMWAQSQVGAITEVNFSPPVNCGKFVGLAPWVLSAAPLEVTFMQRTDGQQMQGMEVCFKTPNDELDFED